MNLVAGEVRDGRLHIAGRRAAAAARRRRRDGAVIAGIRPTDLVAEPPRATRRGCAPARGRRAARLREPPDLPGRRREAGRAGGGRRGGGERGRRGDAARRRRPRALHRRVTRAGGASRPGEAVELGVPPTRCTSSTRRRGRAAVTIPPLAGLFGYEEASRPGCRWSARRQRLWRLGVRVPAPARARRGRAAAHTGVGGQVRARAADAGSTPSTRRARAAGERAAPSVGRRRRRARRRARGVFDELAHVRDTGELLAAGDLVVRGALLGALETYLDGQPARRPSVVRLVEAALRDERAAGGVERGGRGGDAVRGRLAGDGRRAARGRGRAARRRPPGRAARRSAALGGRAAGARPRPCAATTRFADPYNQSALIDEYCDDEARPADERAYALAYKRLREMDVPEWMAPIIAASGDAAVRAHARAQPPALGRDAPRDDGRGRARAPGRRLPRVPDRGAGLAWRSTRASRRARRT